MMPLVYLDYQIRKDFIAKVLCINKEKPKNTCQGKCHLRKQLTKAHTQKTDEKSASPQKIGLEIICIQGNTFSLESVVYTDLETAFPPYQFHHSNTFLASVFHPPTC